MNVLKSAEASPAIRRILYGWANDFKHVLRRTRIRRHWHLQIGKHYTCRQGPWNISRWRTIYGDSNGEIYWMTPLWLLFCPSFWRAGLLWCGPWRSAEVVLDSGRYGGKGRSHFNWGIFPTMHIQLWEVPKDAISIKTFQTHTKIHTHLNHLSHLDEGFRIFRKSDREYGSERVR